MAIIFARSVGQSSPFFNLHTYTPSLLRTPTISLTVATKDFWEVNPQREGFLFLSLSPSNEKVNLTIIKPRQLYFDAKTCSKICIVLSSQLFSLNFLGTLHIRGGLVHVAIQEALMIPNLHIPLYLYYHTTQRA